MIDRASNHNRAHATHRGTVTEGDTLLGFVHPEIYFGYFYYRFAAAGCRSFTLAGSRQK